MSRPHTTRRRTGVALLEVVLSIGIFVGIASVVLLSFHACVRTANRLKLEAKAADLAVTLLSEVQMGLIERGESPPQALAEPDEEWTWELRAAPAELAPDIMPLLRVEVILVNTERDFTYRLVHVMPDEATLGALGGSSGMAEF
jgi:type II secretory pathway pseudopilin PulG